MNASWITLAVVSIVGLTKLLTWWLGKPRRLQALLKRESEILDELRYATVHLDTRRMAILERELVRVRQSISLLM